jgi:Uma2 family endonuclease
MRTLPCDPPPGEFEPLLERRKRLGLDRHDEVWEGVLHIMPSPSGEHAVIAQQLAEILGPVARAAGLEPTMYDFNLGDSKESFRVPDGGLHRSRPRGIWIPTAALVVEILSPGDETSEKLPFYAAHEVDEIVIVDPNQRDVDWLKLTSGEPEGQPRYEPIERSALIELGSAELTRRIDWP